MPLRVPFRFLVILAVVASTTRLADGQEPSLPLDSASEACLAAIPAADYWRVPVFVHAESDDSTPVMRNAGAVIAEAAAQRLRAILGDSGQALPLGDPRLDWRELGGHLHVVVRRDGAIAMPEVADSTDADAADLSDDAYVHGRAAIRLLADAVHALIREDESGFWPPTVRGDSLSFRLRLVSAKVNRAGIVQPLNLGPMTAAFTIPQPWIEEVTVDHGVAPEYPREQRALGDQGDVSVRFTVEPSGRVDERSVRDAWPSGKEPPHFHDREAHTGFYFAARSAVTASSYRPLTVGGCRLAQTVTQSFGFSIEH